MKCVSLRGGLKKGVKKNKFSFKVFTPFPNIKINHPLRRVQKEGEDKKEIQKFSIKVHPTCSCKRSEFLSACKCLLSL